VVGFKGKLTFDTSKPDGTMRKLMDVSRARGLGWTSRITFADGLGDTYQSFLKNLA
jgi:nucleoside-diphosphate-sugar epimerase